jgi:ferredoxin-NADP reductase
MYVTLERVEDVADTIKTFWFKPARPVRYDAGQFIELYLPHDNADNRGQKRWFTLSSAPTDTLLSITTKFTAGRGSTFKQTLQKLPLGSQVMMADPLGDFVLPKDETIPLIFVGGGMGITPIHSMTRWLYDTNHRRKATLIYSVHDAGELAFVDLFDTYYQEHFKPVVGQKLTGQSLVELTGTPEHALYYLSGPEAMTKALADDLHAQGIPRHQIVTDYFPGYPSE